MLAAFGRAVGLGKPKPTLVSKTAKRNNGGNWEAAPASAAAMPPLGRSPAASFSSNGSRRGSNASTVSASNASRRGSNATSVNAGSRRGSNSSAVSTQPAFVIPRGARVKLATGTLVSNAQTKRANAATKAYNNQKAANEAYFKTLNEKYGTPPHRGGSGAAPPRSSAYAAANDPDAAAPAPNESRFAAIAASAAPAAEAIRKANEAAAAEEEPVVASAVKEANRKANAAAVPAVTEANGEAYEEARRKAYTEAIRRSYDESRHPGTKSAKISGVVPSSTWNPVPANERAKLLAHFDKTAAATPFAFGNRLEAPPAASPPPSFTPFASLAATHPSNFPLGAFVAPPSSASAAPATASAPGSGTQGPLLNAFRRNSRRSKRSTRRSRRKTRNSRRQTHRSH
jgi:hypothetical protein